MPRYRHALPQLNGDAFLVDGGLETDLIFNHGIEIREFAAHTLLDDAAGRRALTDYFRPYMDLAHEAKAGFILDSQTWKAHSHWAQDLGATQAELKKANHDSVEFIAGLRDEYGSKEHPVVLSAIIGPRGDAYAPGESIDVNEAEQYHSQQINWLAATEVDMIAATTFTHADEAAGLVRAASDAGLPVVVSFTVETDGKLPSGESLADAIQSVDDRTGGATAYFQVNCAHPDHVDDVLHDSDWARRIRGLRCNASRKSHAELDASETLDPGNPQELSHQYVELSRRMPWVSVFGGCCGTDLRHVAAIAKALPHCAC